jgi:hypothetical protein
MHFSYLVGLLGAIGTTFALPVSNNDQLESATQDVDKRFYYTNYVAPEKRDEDLEKRFYYTRYEGPEKRDENVEKSGEELEKRFYYTNYVAPEKRDEEATNSV